MIRGVLGGSFDPVHNGHVAMARYFLERDLVHCVHVVPAFNSPFKTGTSADALQRLTMVRLAFLEVEGVVVDNREITRSGPSYTVDTLESLAAEYPDDQLLLIIGADNLPGLSGWKNPLRIGDLATIAVLARPGDASTSPDVDKPLPSELRVQYHDDFDEPVSSTRIRAILSCGSADQEDPADFLPPAVSRYILRNQLYRD